MTRSGATPPGGIAGGQCAGKDVKVTVVGERQAGELSELEPAKFCMLERGLVGYLARHTDPRGHGSRCESDGPGA
jgi:hypothetical protein